MKKNYTIKFTREEALANDLIGCECGHPPNNHFQNHPRGSTACVRCGCKEYKEVVWKGKLLGAVLKGKK